MKRVYICHQYYVPSHFKALYDCAKNYGYQIMDFIVLNSLAAKKYHNQFIQQEGTEKADNWYNNNLLNQKKIWHLKDEIIVMGVFPYDSLLLQYEHVLSQNYSIYMTSWLDWHSGDVPFPYQDNKIKFMKVLTHSINGVACVSSRAEQEMLPWNNATQVVNHSININNYKKKSDFKRKRRYVFLGRFVGCKNIEAIIEYLKINPEENIEVDFAGDGPLKESLQNYANYDNRLVLKGYLSKNEIKLHLHEYDYLILPSHIELFGIVLLEALACGVPSIVSNASGPTEIIRHDETGIAFQLNDPKGFENAMNYSMELNDEQYEAMSKNAIRESRKYDVNEVIKKWVALFERVCKK